MVKQNQSTITFLLLPLLFILFISTKIEGANKLFVFGDSYVDTGNALNSGSYKPPSGITYPGTPAGRFSDGRVLTDYIASFLKIDIPISYSLKNSSNLQNGINFAYGGTGFFKTLVDGPNVSVQINSFEQLIQQNVYSKSDLETSLVLLNSGANDYTTFALKNTSLQAIQQFTESLVKEVVVNLRHIQSLGAQKIALTLLQPFGCLPIISSTSGFQNCIDTLNLVATNHNNLILQNVDDLNKEIGKPVFKTLDLYNTFLSTIQTMQKSRAENSTLMNPLEPCCAKDSAGVNCGKVDDKGQKNYTLCEKPELSFFWDNVHPSQNGWSSIYTQLQSSLGQLI
ncbi:hypothetical protein Lal_00021556 [Lupinus albus]|uniref:Putative carboxylesterase n=1 Tax=Lupinus albus TaxID=3870 RepID=A0A6A4NKG6_LUPAL|nr:putative carboxylesterase [Lupinus albus]KAF1860513.1 hypothetical protein Lal_00021556 [Lupinus albus]